MNQINTALPFPGFLETKIGGRKENQDCCGSRDTAYGLLLVVCDGMGGGPGGCTASRLAVESIIESVEKSPKEGDPKEVLVNAIKNANKRLRDKILEEPLLNGMGTTVVALLISEVSATIAHIGDSRAYQLRSKSKKYRTQDHSQVGELVRNGTLTEEQARLSTYSNIITRALGIKDECEVDVIEIPFEKGDRFVLCTDGIWGSMDEPSLIKMFTETPSLSGSVDRISVKIDELGNMLGGGHDNHTIILIESKTNSKLKEKMSTKTKYMMYALFAVASISLLCNIIQYAVSNSENDNSGEIKDLRSKIESFESDTSKLNEKIKKLTKENTSLKNDLDKSKDEINKMNKKEPAKEQKESAKTSESNTNSNNVAEEQNESKSAKTSEAKNSIDKTTELILKIDDIVSRLEDIEGMVLCPKKVGLKNEVVGEMEKLSSQVPELVHSDWKRCIGKLKNPISSMREEEAREKYHNSSVKRHYQIIIGDLNKIKDKLTKN